MPIYQFKCPECKGNMERLQKSSDAAPECPQCDVPMEKQVTAPGGFDLRGNGWYSKGTA